MNATGKIRIGFAALALAAMIGGLAVSGGRASDGQGREVVSKVCGRCHNYQRICLNLERDANWWKQTTREMIGHGAPISPEQADTTAGFLASLEPDADIVCR